MQASRNTYCLLQSKISSVDEAKSNLEFSPSFTPSKERQEIDSKTHTFLKNSQLETQKKLQLLNRRKASDQLAGLSGFESQGLKPIQVKSEAVSPEPNQVSCFY